MSSCISFYKKENLKYIDFVLKSAINKSYILKDRGWNIERYEIDARQI